MVGDERIFRYAYILSQTHQWVKETNILNFTGFNIKHFNV